MTTRRSQQCSATAVFLGLAACGHSVLSRDATPAVRMLHEQNQPQTSLRPVQPLTPELHTEYSIHGDKVVDNYAWLENSKDPAVTRWERAQDAYSRAVIASSPEHPEFERLLRAYGDLDSWSMPKKAGDAKIALRRLRGEDRFSVVLSTDDFVSYRIVIPSALIEPKAAIDAFAPSMDGRYIALRIAPAGADTGYVVIYDTNGVALPDRPQGGEYGAVAWAPDSAGIFYTKYSKTTARPWAQTYYHKLGTNPSQDLPAAPPCDDQDAIQWLTLSADGKYQILERTWPGVRKRLWVRKYDKKLATDISEWEELVTSFDDFPAITVADDVAYILTQWNAPRRRLVARELTSRHSEWREIIPESKSRVLEDFAVVRSSIVAVSSERGASVVEAYPRSQTAVRQLSLPFPGTVSAVSGRPDENTAYLGLSSFLSPLHVWELAASTMSVRPLGGSVPRTDILRDKFRIERLASTSRDGTRVPYFVVSPKDRKGPVPTLITGYGGFGVSMLPRFDASWASWLQRGGALVLANVRGGSEEGAPWHEAAMGVNKQRSFDDFIAISRSVISAGLTTADSLVAYGESNGGLLVAASAIQAPELYGVVIARVPLADMLRFAEVGVGKFWVPEFGSVEVPAQHKALRSYSPYHNIRQGIKYPTFVVVASSDDDRVDAMHARKLVAALQQCSRRPAYLLVQRDAGHMGAAELRGEIEREAAILAFARSLAQDAIRRDDPHHRQRDPERK